jgi:hypothetical protein
MWALLFSDLCFFCDISNKQAHSLLEFKPGWSDSELVLQQEQWFTYYCVSLCIWQFQHIEVQNNPNWVSFHVMLCDFSSTLWICAFHVIYSYFSPVHHIQVFFHRFLLTMQLMIVRGLY